jgi:hypothetical protein
MPFLAGLFDGLLTGGCDYEYEQGDRDKKPFFHKQ